ncbi:MAG: transposase [Bacteroidota bacterium]
MLTAVTLGLMAGCRGLGELERLSETLTPSARKLLGLPRRFADTTLRDTLCRLRFEDLRACLHGVVRGARRRKSLKRMALPLHVVAMDGRGTRTPSWEGPFAQKYHQDGEAPYGLLRTVTSVLVTARGKPCIDVSPIPAETNEMGHFKDAFDGLVHAYPWVELVSYDAGASSQSNGQHVVDCGCHYLFRLNNERHHQQQIAEELLAQQPFIAEDYEVRSNTHEVRRKLKVMAVNQDKLPTLARKPVIWEHAQTLLLIETETVKGGRSSTETRVFISSLPAKTLSSAQWIWTIVRHWRVETAHQILDTAFAEDDAPWIRTDPNGMLVMMVLRRIALTLLALFRSVTQRSEEKRQMPWPELLEWVYITLLKANEHTIAGLRKRSAACS